MVTGADVRDAAPSPTHSLVERIATQPLESAPFPHLVLDACVPTWVAQMTARELRALVGPYTHYEHLTERRKKGCQVYDALGTATRAVIDALYHPEVRAALAYRFGLARELVADYGLEGGGVHMMGRGGFLDLHADFRAHPYERTWKRELNVLLYLTPDWSRFWGGELVLADAAGHPVRQLVPVFNRAVVFATTATSYHGVPGPLTCPPQVARRSIALYYYSTCPRIVPLRSTHYLDRDGVSFAGRVRLRLERAALYAFGLAKRYGGLRRRR